MFVSTCQNIALPCLFAEPINFPVMSDFLLYFDESKKHIVRGIPSSNSVFLKIYLLAIDGVCNKSLQMKRFVTK